MARRRFQSGCLFKRGKRRKVWVARWCEDVLREDGSVGRMLRSVVLGSVADLRVPVKIAQEQLGHASIQTTLNIYTHVVDASHRKAIEAVERELFPTVPKSPDRLAEAVPVSDAVN